LAEGEAVRRAVTCPRCERRCRARERYRGLQRCPHCRAPLARVQRRRRNTRAAALLLAAAILYVPANRFPIFYVELLGQAESDTIFQGIIELFASDMGWVGVVVFFASILVPLLKILGLFGLLIAAERRADGHRVGRTQLYRVIEGVGRWSMIDVFVVSLLISLVQFGSLASFAPGSGAACFALVVVLTMLAVRSFDPRSIWDGEEEEA